MKVYELLKRAGAWEYYSIYSEGQNLTKDGKTSLRNIVAGLENRVNIITAVMLYDVLAFDRAKKIVYCNPPGQARSAVA